MSAAAYQVRSARALPYMTATAYVGDVDVDIPAGQVGDYLACLDDRDLAELGVVRIGSPAGPVIPVIERFHDDEHGGAFSFCEHPVCSTYNQRNGDMS